MNMSNFFQTRLLGEQKQTRQLNSGLAQANRNTEITLATIAVMKEKIDELKAQHAADMNGMIAIKDALLAEIQRLDPNHPLCKKEVREKIYLDNYSS